MGEIWGKIPSEADSSPAVNLWNEISYVLPTHDSRAGTRQTFPFWGSSRKEGRKAWQVLSKSKTLWGTFHQILWLESSPLQPDTLLSWPTDAAALPHPQSFILRPSGLLTLRGHSHPLKLRIQAAELWMDSVTLPFSWSSVYLHPNSSNVWSCVTKSGSLPSFCPVFTIPFSPSLWCFCWYKPIYSWLLLRWLSPWVTPMVSSSRAYSARASVCRTKLSCWPV